MYEIVEIRLTKFELLILEDILKHHLDNDLKNITNGLSCIQDSAVDILLKISPLLNEAHI